MRAGNQFLLGASVKTRQAALVEKMLSGSELWWTAEASKPQYLFQDTAGTVPVTALGQTVARIQDPFGRGYHALQASAASRFVYQQDNAGRFYFELDGVDDSMAITGMDFTGTDKITIWAGVYRPVGAGTGVIAELSASSVSNNGAFGLISGAATCTYRSRGTAAIQANVVQSIAPPRFSVFTGQSSISDDTVSIMHNGVVEAMSGSDAGTGTHALSTLNIGRRNGASSPFLGRIYCLAIRGAASTPAEVAAMNAYVNQKTGAY